LELYFVNEKKNDLPNDKVKLVKYDLLKDKTIKSYQKQISILQKNLLSEMSNPHSNYDNSLQRAELKYRVNSSNLNREMIKQTTELARIKEIGKL
jgi:hypothetical protein